MIPQSTPQAKLVITDGLTVPSTLPVFDYRLSNLTFRVLPDP